TALLQSRLPPGVGFVSATASRGGCTNDNGVVTCDLGTLANGDAATISLEVAPTLGGSLTNVFVLSGNQLDLNPADNTVAVVTTVIPVADLDLTLTPGAATALLGQPVAYTITVTNHGPNVASGIQLTNPYPAGMTFLSAAASQGSCGNAGGILSCALG